MPFALPLAIICLIGTIQSESWTAKRLEHALEQSGKGMTARDADALTKWFGGEDRVRAGADGKVEELNVAVAIECEPGVHEARIVSVPKGIFEASLARIGDSNLYAAAFPLVSGFGMRWTYEVDGKQVGKARELEAYATPSEARPAARQGVLIPQPKLTSKVFGGTTHDWWIYTSPGLDPTKESSLVVFQDGQWSHGYAPVYFDNMVSNGDLAQTVVVFVTPGTFPEGRSDRSREYDTLNDRYVRFLLEELLPPVEAKFKISQDPMRRCVAGLSSGGIASFTAAWERPDKFGLVMSWIGSFTDIASGPTLLAGGHNYPSLIRKTPHKPIRVFLQDGENDLDNEHGNWPLANHEMAKAFEFAKYDYKAVFGQGFHSDKHGRAIMADALRWLFQN